MTRGGMRVLCLEKNHCIGGMATTTELVRGYRFELAGSVQFPIPTQIYDDLDLGACPIYEAEVQSVGIGPSAHRPIGRFDVRTPPKSLDEMFASTTNEVEREAIRTAMFGSVMDVIDRHLPERQKHAQIRGMLAFLSVNSTHRGPYDAGSAMCLAFALSSPGDVTMSNVKRGIGTISDHLLTQFETAGGELRRHVKVDEITVDRGRVTGVTLGDGDRITAPVVVSNLDPTATFTNLINRDVLSEVFARRVDTIDHRALYFQMHRALSGLPEYADQYAVLNDGDARQCVTFIGTPEQMQRDFEGCTQGLVPRSPSVNLSTPTLRDPDLAPPGKHAASNFAFYAPIGATHDEQATLRDEMADRIVATITARAPNFPETIERQCSYLAYTYERMFRYTNAIGTSLTSSPSAPDLGAGPITRFRSKTSVRAALAAMDGRGSHSLLATTAGMRS